MSSLPLFPLGQPLYPGARLALQIFEPRYLGLIRRCRDSGEPFGIILIREGSEVVRPDQAPMPRLVPIGTYARIVDCRPRLPGRLAVTVEGEGKFRLLATTQGDDFLVHGDVEPLPAEAPLPLPPAGEALAALLTQLLRHPPLAALRMMPAIDDGGRLANQLAQLLPLAPEDRFALLAEADPAARLQLLATLVEQAGFGAND